MAVDQSKMRNLPYRIFMVVVGVVMLCWAVAYGYANCEGDRCIQLVQSRLDSERARIDDTKGAID